MFFFKTKKDKNPIDSGNIKDEDFDFESIAKYHRQKDNSKSFQTLSEKTCNDLDLDELFMFIDRTNSKVGQQYLYNKLRVLPNNETDLNKKEHIIDEFINNPTFRQSIQQHLSKLNKEEVFNICSIFQAEHIQPPKWFFIVKLLAYTSLLCIMAIPFSSKITLIFLPVLLANTAIHYWNKKNIYQYLGAIPQLLRLNQVAKNLAKNKVFESLSASLSNSINTINQVRNRMSFFKMEASLQGELEAAFWSLLEIIKVVFLLEPILLFSALKKLDTQREEIEQVFSFVGEVDSLLSIASLREGLPHFSTPIFTDTNNIDCKNLYHPLIVDCISNSINISNKSILLTGSNMSGKTSFIRAIGINIICGQTINTCFAEQITMPKIHIHSAIRISDDLMNDKSYYFEEVLTIKNMLQQSKTSSANLFLLDEIFKGTNTVERISAAKAVLSELSKNNNLVLVSTHDIELTEMLLEEYNLYHFSEIITDDNIDFDYKLKQGSLRNRNAIRILQLNDYPDHVINEALDLSQKFDKIKMNYDSPR